MSGTKPLHIAWSPVSRKVYAGRVKADGKTWCAGKQDVTNQILAILCEMGPCEIVIRQDGKPVVEVVVKAVGGAS